VTEASLIEEEEIPLTPEERQELEWLTKMERCDQCYVAQAFYRIEFTSGFLFLCRHHYMEHEKKIFDQAIDVVDESELL
jgi:hypothetical protein